MKAKPLTPSEMGKRGQKNLKKKLGAKQYRKRLKDIALERHRKAGHKLSPV